VSGVQTLWRTNLVALLFCVGMGERYQFYHFIPMHTFWLCVSFVVLRTKRNRNGVRQPCAIAGSLCAARMCSDELLRVVFVGDRRRAVWC
jgi:hypothetical protein